MQSYGPPAELFDRSFSAFPQELRPTKLQQASFFIDVVRFIAGVLLIFFWSTLSPSVVNGTTLGTLSATATSANLGSVPLGTKNSQLIQLKNSGSAMLILSKATLTGSGFSMSNLYIPLWLAPGVTMNLTVTFAPTSAGSVTGSIAIKSNGSDPTLTMALSGTGVPATRTLSLSTSSLSFGSEPVGGSSTLGVTVKNTGNSSVTVSGISVSGAGFSVASGISGVTIAAGQSAILNVLFAPKSTGSVSGKVTLTSNATDSTLSVATSGNGVSSTSHWVTLSWLPSTSAGVIGYYVYRSTVSGESYSRMTAAATTAAKYTDGTVVSGAIYYYVVTALSSNGQESARSEQVMAQIP